MPDLRPIGALALATLAAAGCAGATRRAPAPGAPVQPPSLPTSVASGCIARGPVYTERVATRAKLVALTFDDGPTEFTRRILDVLESRRVHATFFVIGEQAADEPEQLRRALTDGDLLGNHTYTHEDMLRVTLPRLLDELVGTQQAIFNETGFTPCFWRAPYGSIDARRAYIARGLGLLSVQWDTDPKDFDAPPAATIVDRVLHGNPQDPDEGVRPGSIVLLHDGGGNRSHTVAALGPIIDALRARGYRFVTVAELLRLALVHGRPAAEHGGPAQQGVGRSFAP